MLKTIKGILTKAVIVDLIAFVIVAVIWWFSGEHTVTRIFTTYFWSGVILFALGIMGGWGSITLMGDFFYQFARTASPMSIHERTKQDWKDMVEGGQFTLVLWIAALIAILVGFLVAF